MLKVELETIIDKIYKICQDEELQDFEKISLIRDEVLINWG